MSTERIIDKPDFSPSQAQQLLREKYGVLVSNITVLPSERDQNFRVTDEESGKSLVFKIANPGADPGLLQLQNEMLDHFHRDASAGGFRFPAVQQALNRQAIARYHDDEKEFVLRLVDYLPGRPIALFRPHDEALLQQFGKCLGQMTNRLQSFEHASARRVFDWDLSRASDVIESYQSMLVDSDRQLVEAYFGFYQKFVLPVKDEFRRSIIHNDANDYNVVIDSDNLSLGLIDFGDVVFSETVNELAIAAAYSMLSAKRPVESVGILTAAFHQQFPLTEAEMESVFPLACMRLCVSLCMSAKQSAESDDPYLMVTTQPARDLLNRLVNDDFELAIARIRAACGKGHFRNSASLLSFLADNRFADVMGTSIHSGNAEMVDLSVATSSDSQLSDKNAMQQYEDRLFQRLHSRGKQFAIGRYDEPRFCYLGDQFKTDDAANARTIHIGLDVFAPASSPVYCPLAGVVHSFQDNDLPFDYGPTIILEHHVSGLAEPFFTLYGHLSRQSLTNLSIGQRIESGEAFATLGSIDENGMWPAHLHFQIIQKMLGRVGDFPGVADPDQRELWRELCPDPNLILKMDQALLEQLEQSPSNDDIMTRRRNSISPSLSVSYQQPIQMVRGQGAYLFDAEGRNFLDMVNNVCHVGHANPTVANAIASQAARLNTNTRYLHQNLVRYAEQLCETLPDHLEVCFFVNSGSEANDLALRLARNFTQRESVICLDGAYHGHTASLIDISPYKFNSAGGRGCPATTYVAPMPDVYRGKFRVAGSLNERQQSATAHQQCAQQYVDDFENLVDSLVENGNLPAAVIAEPILSCGGQIVPPPGYLSGIFAKTRERGGVCISDEVQIGFGRVGETFWGFQLDDAVPDIVTMGKPIANGHPMGAVVTTREIADAFNNGMEYFNTFGGNPVSCAAGMAVLDFVQENRLQQHANSLGQYLVENLLELAAENPMIGDVRGKGLFCGIEFVVPESDRQPNPRAAKFVVNSLREDQILLSTDGPEENVIKIKPPLVIQRSDIELVLRRLQAAFRELPLI